MNYNKVFILEYERIHKSLDYFAPNEVYTMGTFLNINNEEVA